jgi:hypothetical protein
MGAVELDIWRGREGACKELSLLDYDKNKQANKIKEKITEYH